MRKQIVNVGKVLTKKDQKQINGGQVPDYCLNNTPGYRAECREIALSEFIAGRCPNWDNCFSLQPTGCIDMCMQEPGGL
ncbi:hypothetical protein [Tenacibaculum singaporense]|nr:hypothetical protein [Tenacibaculum singaporense]